MKKTLLGLVSISAFLLSGCFFDSGFEENYEEKDIAIYREKDKVDKKISLRFFESSPNVPYIAVNDFFKEFFNMEYRLIREGNNYIYYSIYGGYLRFESDFCLVSIQNPTVFNYHPDTISNRAKTYDKAASIETTPNYEKTIRLSNYYILVHSDGNEAYLPLSFLSSLAGGLSGYNVAYNGKDIYVLDYNASLTNEVRDPAYYGSDKFYEVILDKNSERPYDLASNNYWQLCFVFDNLRGYTSQLVFGDNNLLTIGLDGILSTYYPKIKEYLLSKDKNEYMIGFTSLMFGLSDGGHTGATCKSLVSPYYNTIKNDSDLSDLYQKGYSSLFNKSVVKVAYQTARKKVFSDIQSNELGFYYKKDDVTKTAYIGFDSFTVDYRGWEDFYNNKTNETPINTDTYAFVLDKFYQAQNDGMKNIVFDLTSNGGGNTGAVMGLVGLLNEGKADFIYNNTVSMFRSTEHHLIDINLDGKWDDKDVLEAKKFDFNIGVLTSEYSFSAANLFPSLLKEFGYKIIGSQSGGGSCAVSRAVTSDGLDYVHSSYLCLGNKTGENIDSGVPVDYFIDYHDDEGYYYPLSYFDCNITGNYLSNAYNI